METESGFPAFLSRVRHAPLCSNSRTCCAIACTQSSPRSQNHFTVLVAGRNNVPQCPIGFARTVSMTDRQSEENTEESGGIKASLSLGHNLPDLGVKRRIACFAEYSAHTRRKV